MKRFYIYSFIFEAMIHIETSPFKVSSDIPQKIASLSNQCFIMPWYVIITKPNSEIKTAKILENMGVEVFCPVIEEVRQWSDRKKKFTVPLFRTYVFVKLLDKDRSVVFDVPWVLKYLFWLGKPATVDQKEIEVIKDWLSNDTMTNVEVSKFKPGESLTIKKGAFKNKKAVIQEISKTKLKLVLPGLGIFLTADINDVI